MEDFENKAEMAQYSEDHVDKGKLMSSCVTPQLAGGSPTKEHSHDQQLMERESPDSPSPVKRWEIGPLLQSFKSKMASFTEIVMSPVRLFKPADSLSSIGLPDQREHFMIESNVKSSIQTEEEETTDNVCKNGLFSKRPSSEGVQCNSPPKRYRVAQRLNFGTVSTSNHDQVLEPLQMHDDAQFAPNEEENQMDRPSGQPQAILQDEKNDTSPCTVQSPILRSRIIPSSDKPLSFSPAINTSCQASATVELQRLSSSYSSDTACEYSSQSKAVLEDRTKTNFLNKPDSSSTSSDFHLKDEYTKRGGSEEPCSRATRKSPRKLFKHPSETARSTSTKLAAFVMGPKTLDDEMKKPQSINVTKRTYHSDEVSDPPKSKSVGEVKSKRCREAPRTGIKKDTLARRKCALRKAEGGGLRPAKNKKGKGNSIVLEGNQEDIICVQIRKKRKGISGAQDSNMPLSISNTADVEKGNSETTESCDSTEFKEIGQEKTVRILMRKNPKCRALLTSDNEGDAADITSSQNSTRNVLIDKNLHITNMNTLNVCNYEYSRLSKLPESQHSMQAQEAKKTKTRKTRQHVLSGGDAPLQKRILRPHKHTFEDFSATSVVDPAGPSRPSKRTPLQSDRFCDKSQRTIIAAEEQEKTSLKTGLMSPPVQPDSTALLQSERDRKLSKPTKVVNRHKIKHVSVAKRKSVIGGEDIGEIGTMEASPVVSSSGSGFNRLLRSYSCPEIPSLLFGDSHIPLSNVYETSSTSPTKKSSPIPLPTYLHSPSKRTRRHTVCSVEIEREIAPLCLRKEVYPATRGGPSHPLCPSSPYSPSTSLTALASCFLSSPLAFLSSSLGRGLASDITSSASSFTSSCVMSSSPSLCRSPLASTLTSSNPLTGPSTVVTPCPEMPSASVSSLCSTFSQTSMEQNHGILRIECEDEEERSNFGLQPSPAISEEKALSDSEIKADSKEIQRGKVSSIRICKKIPKPLNNLTPMGLPKVIRIKKKNFSLEEIYTNKNFSKPPDGRLETIYEVPLHRRDGSQAVVGQKKVKRFLEFPELGVSRKPKKSLVGGIGGSGAQRKAGGNSGICRTRRGVGASSKVDDGLTLQELDSLLCSRLEELDTWMAFQQVTC